MFEEGIERYSNDISSRYNYQIFEPKFKSTMDCINIYTQCDFSPHLNSSMELAYHIDIHSFEVCNSWLEKRKWVGNASWN